MKRYLLGLFFLSFMVLSQGLDDLALKYFPTNFEVAREEFGRGATYFASKVSNTHDFLMEIHNISGLPLIVAIFEPRDKARFVHLQTAAIHGYGEGKLGNAFQQMLFHEQDGLNPAAKLISVQAVNPFGYANFVRENENGVDLNRNGMYDNEGIDAELDEIHRIVNELLIPKRPRVDKEVEARHFLESASILISTYGHDKVRNALAMGGYNPGLFYKGKRGTLEKSLMVIGDVVERESDGVDEFSHLDIHSGYGPDGGLHNSTHLRTDSHQFAKLAQVVPNLVSDSTPETGGSMFPVSGSLIDYTNYRSKAKESFDLIVDAGVLDEVKTLEILAARYRAFHYGGSKEVIQRSIEDMERAFCPKDPKWRANAIQLFRELMQQINSEFNIYIQQELHSVGV